MRTRRFLALACAFLVAVILAGCVQGTTVSAPNDPRSGAGLRYGLAPEPDSGTTFQKNVVLIQGGANSVRSVTADGLTWTLDPKAPGVSDLKLGRVMFVTDRGVGKVMAIHNAAEGLEVTIGPVTLTDVIEKGHYASKKPIALAQPVAIDGSGTFWDDPDLQKQSGVSDGNSTDLPAGLIRAVPSAGQIGPPRSPSRDAIVSDVIQATTGNFAVTGGCCSNGAGVDLAYKKPGFDFTGSVKLNMKKPEGEFDLDISGGKVNSAHLSVSGAASVTAKIHIVTEPNNAIRGWSPPLATDFQFSVPIDRLLGVPLAMTVTQNLNVQVNIPGQAVFDGYGKVGLGATLGFSYENGKYTNVSKAEPEAKASLDGTSSIAVGISFASFWYDVRFNVGIGYLGFVAGVYFSLGVHITPAVGAPFGINELPGAKTPIEACKSVQTEIWINYGVGYTIPKSVVKIINSFLKVFNSDPLKPTGGIGKDWTPVNAWINWSPDTALCRKSK